MDTVKLIAHKRQETGKGPARRLRRAGKVPAALYGRGKSEALAVDAKELLLIRQSEAGVNTVIDLVIGGENPETCSVILREVQIDPIDRTLVHADFYRVALDEPITVAVPLELINVPEDRFKAAQAELATLLYELQIQCLPREIPSVITADLQDMQVGDVIHAGSLTLPPGVTLVSNADEAVATAAVTAAPSEAEAEADAEMTEPEGVAAAEEAPDS